MWRCQEGQVAVQILKVLTLINVSCSSYIDSSLWWFIKLDNCCTICSGYKGMSWSAGQRAVSYDQQGLSSEQKCRCVHRHCCYTSDRKQPMSPFLGVMCLHTSFSQISDNQVPFVKSSPVWPLFVELLFFVTIEWQKMDLQIHNLLALKIIRKRFGEPM